MAVKIYIFSFESFIWQKSKHFNKHYVSQIVHRNASEHLCLINFLFYVGLFLSKSLELHWCICLTFPLLPAGLYIHVFIIYHLAFAYHECKFWKLRMNSRLLMSSPIITYKANKYISMTNMYKKYIINIKKS